MEPVTTGLTVMEVLNSGFATNLAGGLGKSLGAGSPAAPSNATSGAYGSGLDGSGWLVNFAGVQNASSNQDKSGGVPGVGFTGAGIGGVPWYVWALLAGAVVWRLKKSNR